jgi:hypothetical protein
MIFIYSADCFNNMAQKYYTHDYTTSTVRFASTICLFFCCDVIIIII